MTHACPQGIKLLQAVIVSLFHKVGIFNDVQTLFLYMLVCHSWTQHLLCILMSAELLSALLGLIGQFCRAPWGKWQHGEEAAERGGAGWLGKQPWNALRLVCKSHCQHLRFNLDTSAVMKCVMAFIIFYYSLLTAEYGRVVCLQV